MSNYIKKYNTGNIMVDLPHDSYIHELPLLNFSDFRNSVNISLVFNHKLKQDNNNMFNINNGYKLNIQKRIVMDSDNNPNKFIDSNGKQVLLIKNYNTLDQSTPFNGVYTFDDESKRVLRSISTGYEIEHEDLSREEYNLNGYIKKIKDKYGDTYLSYNYNSNNNLSSVTYNGKTVYFGYFLNQLNYIEYGNTETTLEYSANKITVYHYSGVTYESTLTGNNYKIEAKTSEVLYSKECKYYSDNMVIESKIDNDVIDTVTYTFPDIISGDYTSFKQVEVTNKKGVTHRIQFLGETPLYSYEINNDAKFYGVKFKGNVNIYDQLYKEDNNKVTNYLSYYDGIQLSLENSALNRWSTNVLYNSQAKGYYLLTGWAKLNDDNISYEKGNIGVSNNTSELGFKFNVNFAKPRQWHFFACKFYIDANYIFVRPEYSTIIEFKDIRVLFQKTHEVDETKKEKIIIPENILIENNVNSTRIIPFTEVEFEYATENGDNGKINVSLSDLIRYIKRNKINENNNSFSKEIYYNDGKNVINDVLWFDVIEKSAENKSLLNYDIGYRYYKDGRTYETRIEKYNSLNTPYCIINYIDGSDYIYQYVNKYFETIESVVDNISTYYTRDKGLITQERVDSLSNVTYNYNGTSVEVKDLYNNNYLSEGVLYHMDPTWGTIYKVEYSDGTVLEDVMDDDKTTMIKKRFCKGTNVIENNFDYSKSKLSSLFSNGLNYDFTYSKDKLIGVKKFETIIEEQEHENTYDKYYYPNITNKVYSKEYEFDKYDRLLKVIGELENTYDDDINFKLVSTIDKITNLTENYTYNASEGTIKKISVSSNNSNIISNETFEYDKENRLTLKEFEYNVTLGNKVKDEIEYEKQVNDPYIDQRVKSSKYYINDVKMTTSSSVYDNFKRLTEKDYEFKKDSLVKTYGKAYYYSYNRINQERTNLSNISSNVIQYTYDNFDRISNIQNVNKLSSYQYDDFGRLIRENNEALDKTIVYEYNDIGNITSKKIYDYTIATTPTTLLSTIPYEYDTIQKDRLISYNNTTIPYNVLGCPTKLNDYNLTWSKGKLVGLSKGTLQTGTESYTYTYNAYGQRVSKVYNKITGTSGIIQIQPEEVVNRNTQFNYDYSGRLINEIIVNTCYNGSTINEKLEYIYDVNTIIGMKYTKGSNTNTYYFERNILGDVLGIYDLNGNLKVKYLYDAYGNCTVSSETTDQQLAKVNPIRYRGYYYDVETGLFYCNSRYYNPEWCRWISPDDIEYLDPESVNGLNLYCYCGNDPINKCDPSGHMAITLAALLIGGLVAGAIGAGIGLGTAIYNDVKEDGKWFNGDWTDYVGRTLGGFVAGFGVGVCTVLGAGVGAAALGGTTATLFTASGLTLTYGSAMAIGTTVAGLTGMAGYAVRSGISRSEDFNVANMVIEGVFNAASGALSVFGGYLGGSAGFHNTVFTKMLSQKGDFWLRMFVENVPTIALKLYFGSLKPYILV